MESWKNANPLAEAATCGAHQPGLLHLHGVQVHHHHAEATAEVGAARSSPRWNRPLVTQDVAPLDVREIDHGRAGQQVQVAVPIAINSNCRSATQRTDATDPHVAQGIHLVEAISLVFRP